MSPLSRAYDLPDLGEHSATVFTEREEAEIGKAFFFTVAQHLNIISDLLIQEYIQRLGEKLVAHSKSPQRKFHFFVVLDPEINAFAGPGAYVGINTGAILTARTESELAAIMAHEISHVTQHHIERMYEQSTSSSIGTIAAVAATAIVGIAANSNSASSAASGAMVATMAGAAQHRINFTREEEAEADRIGMRVLAAAGFNPKAMAASFQHIQRASFDFANPNDYPAELSDHPQTDARIADASDREIFYASKASYKSSKEFYLMQTRVRTLQFGDSNNATKFFQNMLNKSNNEYARYGYALALDLQHKFIDAEKNMRLLAQNDPQEIYYQLDLADIQEDAKKGKEAEATLQNLLQANPYYYPLIMQYGDTLLKNNKPQAATNFLRNKAMRFYDKSDLYFLLAQAEAKSGDLFDAYLARAKAMELEGLYHAALLLLQQAQRMPNISSNDKAIIVARIQQIKKKMVKN